MATLTYKASYDGALKIHAATKARPVRLFLPLSNLNLLDLSSFSAFDVFPLAN